MRYFFGYTSTDPRAFSIDTAGGATGPQHVEYVLGTVDITTNAFNLYVNDAVRLGGTNDVFGWAWVRLAPVEPEPPVDITFNLYEDSHQDPDLTTTSDVPTLTSNSVNQQWTEFLYTTSRPYPSIMGSALHIPVTPTMHFSSTGIPNGEYEVFALLYDTNPLQYFFGFSSDDPQAASVNTAGGASGEQHREYSLGTITITNGAFDLYVNRADELPGATYDIFGWARIRLSPRFTISSTMTISSSSQTMEFDGDGDGTFGEAGDNTKPFVNGTLTIAARDSSVGEPTITATDFIGQTGSREYIIYNPTSVMVSSFSGQAYHGVVQLDWETATEVNLLGFNVYRSQSLAGPKEKLNTHLIEAKYSGQVMGTAYQFTQVVEMGQRFYYWLERVQTRGRGFEEPVVVQADYQYFLPFVKQ
jgi:hypothetical protein